MRLIAAQVGAGKTETVQRAILDLKVRDPLARVWALLSTERQIIDFRRRFMAQQNAPIFNVEYFNFYQLYRRLLALAGEPQRCIDDTARLTVLRDLLSQYTQDDGVFARVADKRGFVQIVGTFIYELKQNLITPQDFTEAAHTPKERELAAIYDAYQTRLQTHQLVDREGEGWVALAALERQPQIVTSVDLLVVDGYDQFNLLQAQLLAALGTNVETLVTLTDVPGRAGTIGRRFIEARERLNAACARRGVTLAVETKRASAGDRHPALLHLLDHVMQANAPKMLPDGVITLFESPDPASETAAALRQVKRLLLGGAAPDDILIAVRDWSLYGAHFAALRRVYDLPLALHWGEPVATNPAVIALRALLDLHTYDFRRRDLLDVLASPYFRVPGIDAESVQMLERIAADFLVTGGREAWIKALELAAQPPNPDIPLDADDEERELTTYEHADTLKAALIAFFDAVTPPENALFTEYADWFDTLTGVDNPDPDDEPDEDTAPAYTLDLPAAIRANPNFDARDAAAIQVIKYGLQAVIAAEHLTRQLSPNYTSARGWTAFKNELDAIIDVGTAERGVGRDGRVLVTSVTDARGLPHRHVVIVGMAEGVFPMPTPEDPLLLDSERERLRAAGVMLTTQAERAADDGLFYGLIGLAHESLTLTRPTYKDGDAWAASHLWRAVTACFDDLHAVTLKPGEVHPYEDALTSSEAALAVADALSRNANRRGMGWLTARHGAYWNRIKAARAVERKRLSRQPHDHYTGRLRDESLIASIRERLHPGMVWSATALNAYGMCGFRYFAARLLKLEAIRDPEEGMDARQLGTLYHELFEHVYREIAEAGLSITPENLPAARDAFARHADSLIATAPERLRFRPSALWMQEAETLKRKALRLIETDFAGENPITKTFSDENGARYPFQLEATFGLGDSQPITINLGDGERLRVRGALDRIDRIGNRVVIVDYKTGSTTINASEIQRGRNFQMLIYLEAARVLFPDATVAGGVFWSIGKNDHIGRITDKDTDALSEGKAHLSRYLTRMRAGDFAAEANQLHDGKCANYCDFARFCRVQVTHRGKP